MTLFSLVTDVAAVVVVDERISTNTILARTGTDLVTFNCNPAHNKHVLHFAAWTALFPYLTSVAACQMVT